MSTTSDYIPSRESDLVTWCTNFNTKIGAAPTSYGLTALQATAFAALRTSFVTAYTTANAPDTRSPSNIAAKNTAKVNMIDGPGGIRDLAALVQAAPGITPAKLSELGLTVRDREPSPIPAPTVAPEIDFIPTGLRPIRIRLHNESTLNRRKPEGVQGATIFYHIGELPPEELSQWTYHQSVTRTTLEVDLPASVAPGSKVWFTAFWFNPRLQPGPAATPVSTWLQFGGLSSMAA